MTSTPAPDTAPERFWWVRRVVPADEIGAAPRSLGPAHVVKATAVHAARRSVRPFRYWRALCDVTLRGDVHRADTADVLPEDWRACRRCLALATSTTPTATTREDAPS